MTRRRTIIAFASLCLCSPCAAPGDTLTDAIWMVEGSQREHLGRYADHGSDAIGPFGVHEAYFIDSGIRGAWSDCESAEFSRRVVEAYARRYGAKSDYERACLHHLGPNWRAKKYAGERASYWNRVREAMR